MTKTIWGIRSGLIGDTLMSLPILEFLYETHPDYYKLFVIEQKCKQAAELYRGHPHIDNILITVHNDGLLTQEEENIKNSCDIIFNIAPPHPREQDWFNYRNCVEETALMAGIDPVNVKNKKPKLYKWFETEKYNKTIAIFPFAGYNKWHSRNPTPSWWQKTIKSLIEMNYSVLHCGYITEPTLSQDSKYKKITNLEYFEQIKITHACNLTIGTDSGSMWAVGAYGLPQINLLTNHMGGCHNRNFLALAPENYMNNAINLFAENCCDNIKLEDVLKAVLEIDKND